MAGDLGQTERSALDDLLALYHPLTPRGNFQPDIAHRGANEMLSRAIVVLGFATEAEVAAEFRRRDDEAYERSEAFIRKMETERNG